MTVFALRPPLLAALFLSSALAISNHQVPAADSPPPSAPQEATALADTAGKEAAPPETPEARAERLKKQQEDDKKNAEFESQRRKNAKSADAREKAIDKLLAQVEKSPKSFELRFKLANAYQDAGHLNSALLQYNEAVRIDSTQSKGWVNRGVVLKELGRMDDATESFQRAVEINPNDALGHVNLGDMLLTRKAYPEAVDAYRRALVIDPASASAYYSLAIAFAESGMYRDAARAWRKSAELCDARGTPTDKSNAERARDNAKLMEEIVTDAVAELESRKQKQRELEAAGSEGTAGEAGAKEPGAKEPGGKEPETGEKPKDKDGKGSGGGNEHPN